ncbi:hypothetical protein ROS62_20715 [Streptomyces sp. DSM 41972]|uniref:Uncharacterized protein n=1 Tax=Streptomyces althioticus subsp. attaecolombicae TaxID=3075534 RepID=A0ABU3I3W6_9ACTN|nr:hypothetical protein [Streptomyces sp. DSM 41972]SCD68661.1 hypothetical protein GA0115238_12025 [Streptomyces sp. di50b]SCD73752.1 hypothetical protein GA0115245_11245 [Streptomyces sp. di188]
MPTPYGSRGGLAFGAEELRVLRRALALALYPSPATADDVQDCLRLAASLDEATRESARLRAFLVADLGRYRAALPGTAAGYLALLEEVLGAGYRPQPDDLAALRALRGNPTAAALLRHCERVRLTALPGGLASVGRQQEREQPQEKPEERPSAPHPAPNPSPEPAPGAPRPARRPVPTPGEVFPRRKPVTPPGQHLAAG